MQYTVTVFQPRGGFRRAIRTASLTFETGEVTVEAPNEKAGAVAGWFELVGKNRIAKMQEMNAPAAVIALASDQRKLAEDFIESSLPGIDYIFDNRVESWLVSIE